MSVWRSSASIGMDARCTGVWGSPNRVRAPGSSAEHVTIPADAKAESIEVTNVRWPPAEYSCALDKSRRYDSEMKSELGSSFDGANFTAKAVALPQHTQYSRAPPAFQGEYAG